MKIKVILVVLSPTFGAFDKRRIKVHNVNKGDVPVVVFGFSPQSLVERPLMKPHVPSTISELG